MHVIHKYEIPKVSRFQLELPCGSEVLAVQTQKGLPVMWVRKPVEYRVHAIRVFRVVMTGEPFDFEVQAYNYIGTTQVDNLVLHLFEVKL